MKPHQQPTPFAGKEKHWEGAECEHPEIRENDEDGPLSKALESRGMRTVWVIFVIHKIAVWMDLERLNPISQRFRPAFAEAASRRQV